MAIIAISSVSALGNSGKFFSRVIHSSDQAFTINLPAKQFLFITNFVQDGGDTAGAVTVYQGAAGLPGINVLIASPSGSTTHEVHEDTYIGGPVVVTIAPVSDGTLFISYLLGNN
jgi:hypothetical protein